MDMLFRRFFEILTGERTLYSQLVQLSQEKKDAVSQNKIDELDRIVRDEQNQLVRLQEWERARRKCAEEFAQAMGRPAGDIGMKDFLEACPAPQKPMIEKLYRELLSVVEEQAALNDINRQLIEQRLEYIDMMVGSAQPVRDTSHVYDSAGGERKKWKPNLSIIDRKV